MHPGFRAAFNAAFTPALASAYARDLARRAGVEPGFRLAETPVFLTGDLTAALAGGAHAILAQLSRPEALVRMKRAIPDRWATPGMDALPSLTQVDFAIVKGTDGRLAPRLIELQGFPSLSAFEVLQSDAWNETLSRVDGLPEATWSPYFSGLSREGFVALLSRTIVGDADPEEVVLLDLEPEAQKTAIDFAATKNLIGVDAVDPRSLVKEGRRLFRAKDGRRVPLKRIYNRVVFDELIKKDLELPFDFRDDLDVRWVPHPNWYWTWSKYSLPLLAHETVPKATYLSELGAIPKDLTERYVLKPLFSFAGGGVNVDPRPEDLLRIPEGERGSWCLQEKIAYDPCLVAADGGGVKVEVRMMFFRPDADEAPTLSLNLCRLSRGKMLGVDFNKDFTWVGSSVALQPA
ncbi:MAG TPA: hypothetical protein VLJ18_12090 [Thermoanaerobaculia bacterium]|nr:hypothetical protein [Thermoanaerobaculia bacterium]